MQNGSIIVLNRIASLHGMDYESGRNDGYHYYRLSNQDIVLEIREFKGDANAIAKSGKNEFQPFCVAFNEGLNKFKRDNGKFLMNVVFPYVIHWINKYDYYKFNFKVPND